MSFLRLKHLVVTVVLGLLMVALPIHAQTAVTVENEPVSQASNSDNESSVICKRAQIKLSRFQSSLEDFKDQQLTANRTILAVVNNIALRLEHNTQADKGLLSDDVTELNSLITRQEIAYAQLQSDLRTAGSVSCTSTDDLSTLHEQVYAIRKSADNVNDLQSDFEDYITNVLIVNLQTIQQQLDAAQDKTRANT